jgi:NAD(P)-dependent dehydrogenase (short-subunit alcohol dehydrogenase family)
MSDAQQEAWKAPEVPAGCNVPVSGPLDLRGRVAVVTGARSGIGQAAALALGRAGARLAVSDLAGCDETVARLKAWDPEAVGIGADVTREADCARLASAVLERFGRIDVLVTSAGVLDLTPIEELSLEEWNRVIAVDLTGTFLAVQAVWGAMKRQKRGRIVCLGSLAARVGGALSGPHYVAAKAGVTGLVKWCAKAGAPDGILANAIAPGLVWTPMTRSYPIPESAAPVGRIGRPEDIAQTVVFLASDMSSYMTGCVLDVNGGIYMTP